MMAPSLDWLPKTSDVRARLAAIRELRAEEAWDSLVALANHRLDFVQTNALDHVARQVFPNGAALPDTARQVRLALLGSSTVTHLQPALRVAGLRRGFHILVHETNYGLYRHELLDTTSGLHAFKPNVVLFALDARHLAAGVAPTQQPAEVDAVLDGVTASLTDCWKQVQDVFHASVLQQAVLPVFPDLLGGNEHRLAGSPAAFVNRLNARLRDLADAEGVHIVAVDRAATRYGIDCLHHAPTWHHSKQEISLPAAPLFGELVGRTISALAGRSAKCLVLDLDNTLWGGVVGDDGIDGIVLGQGSAVGEGFVRVQQYAADLSDRGVILAVCSKNDENVAWRAFDEHPEMVLKRKRIASFVANWENKATNLRQIAAELNIGLDALVLLDDSPYERELVRQALPMVAVPEIPEEPTLVPQRLADAGYFESVVLTEDDRLRTEQYRGGRERRALQASTTDLEGYLRDLDMRLLWQPFNQVGLQRIVQLINKTNQFNLTTRRTTEEGVVALMRDERSFGLQFRLIDRFGDNGIIAVVIGHAEGEDVRIETWLMSCRVLGRQVEQAMLSVVAEMARRKGARRLVGEYIPTPRNGIVTEHYQRLGFIPLDEVNDVQRSVLALGQCESLATFMKTEEYDND